MDDNLARRLLGSASTTDNNTSEAYVNGQFVAWFDLPDRDAPASAFPDGVDGDYGCAVAVSDTITFYSDAGGAFLFDWTTLEWSAETGIVFPVGAAQCGLAVDSAGDAWVVVAGGYDATGQAATSLTQLYNVNTGMWS